MVGQGFAFAARFTYENLVNGYVTNGKWSEKKYNEYNAARAIIPGYAAYADYQIGKQQNETYFDRYGMTWDDVRQPWNLPGDSRVSGAYSGAVSTATRALNFVSRNIEKLYGDEDDHRSRW